MNSAQDLPQKRVTICVLLFGDHLQLARQCIDSIIEFCDREHYQLFVGCNACCPETFDYVHSVKEIDRLFVSKINLDKCPLQRQMFQALDTELFWWFDDDSYVMHPRALSKRIELADDASEEICLWGPGYYWLNQDQFNFGTDVIPWIKRQPWYSGKTIPSCETGNWSFVIGANWFGRTSIVKKLDWPPPTFTRALEDTLFCEAIRQSGYQHQAIPDYGVKHQTAERRTPESAEMILKIVGKTNNESIS